MYILQSKTDGRNFTVDQKVINASVLLKNLAEFTEITEPIILDCSSQCLETFIKLISHLDSIKNYQISKFEKELFKNFDDDIIAELVKEMTYLDSDVFMDAVADIILDKMKIMSFKKMQEYLGLEDDFTVEEREMIKNNKLEYLIGMKNGLFQFPFPNTNFLTLKSKFPSPMNAVLARVIKRSNGKIAYRLSMINKTLKNEINRHPIKVTTFHGGYNWVLNVDSKSFVLKEYHDVTIFNAIKKRKVIPYHQASMNYDYHNPQTTIHSSSLDFVIPEKVPRLTISFSFSQNINQIYDFDIKRCPFPSVGYHFIMSQTIDFDEFYQQLIAKDLSKEIKIDCWNAFNFFSNEYLHIFKKPDASKFHEILFFSSLNNANLLKFNHFIAKYMEDDGIIRSHRELFEIPNGCKKKRGQYVYEVATVKEYLKTLNLM